MPVDFILEDNLSAYDIVDGELEVQVDPGDFNVDQSGDFLFTVSATDTNGNTKTETFMITVFIAPRPE